MVFTSAAFLPDIIGYEFLRPLDSGSMGLTGLYRAERDGRLVVVKVPRGDSALLARFRREARVLAELDHPNVLKAERFSGTPERPYLITPYYEAGDLRQRLGEGTVAPEEAAVLALGVARGLRHAHERGILHRDIKPANILLAPGGVAVIADWGLARLEGDDSDLTQYGAALGTPRYWSPEQRAGRNDLVDERSDVYSLGRVLWDLLGGFGWRPDPALSRVVDRCVRHAREERYPSAARLESALRRFLKRARAGH